MLAVDTNVVVRYLVGDDPVQARRARTLIDGTDITVCTSVLLETGWVLRRLYGFAPLQIVAALRGFAGLPHVTIEDAARVKTALDWTEAGMDFADALHLAKAAGGEAFVSFDVALARMAQRAGAPPVRAP